MKVYRLLLALIGLGLCIYGLHCALHMWEYVGTGQYWTNAWFIKANASIIGVIAIHALMPKKPGKNDGFICGMCGHRIHKYDECGYVDSEGPCLCGRGSKV